MITLLLLAGISIPDFWREVVTGTGISGEPLGWDALLRKFMHRLPLIVPLVWLAIYSGRNYSMAVRMEEDYAYKEAVSSAFEGYRREMGSIPAGSGESPSPLITLCGNVLEAIYQRPGRIYEGEHHDPTPLTPILNSLEKIAAKINTATPVGPDK